MTVHVPACYMGREIVKKMRDIIHNSRFQTEHATSDSLIMFRPWVKRFWVDAFLNPPKHIPFYIKTIQFTGKRLYNHYKVNDR